MKQKRDMKVFIVGAGSIGYSVASQLSREGCEVTIIDNNVDAIDAAGNSIDAIAYKGNGASYNTLADLNVKDADLLLALAQSDEINILSCFTANQLGCKHTIARIREIDYSNQNNFYKGQLGINMIINPDLASAAEIFRTLRFPIATRIELYAGGKAELVEMAITDDSPLIGRNLMEIRQNMQINLLVCAIVRDGEAFVPKGSDIIEKGDIIYLTGAASEFRDSFRKLKMSVKPLQSVMIAGNDRITVYLAYFLTSHGVNVTIVDRDKETCNAFAEGLPKASIMCEDALRYFDSMSESDIKNTDAFVAISTDDEYNLIAAMYAETQGIGKVVAKVGARSRLKVLPKDTRISTISREDVAVDRILGYTRALFNVEDNDAVESLYRLLDGKLEFIEFKIKADDKNINVPLKDLKFKKNILLAGIIRNGSIIMPTGQDSLMTMDVALVASAGLPITRIEDIYE